MAGFRNIFLLPLLLAVLAGFAQRVKPSFNLNGAVALPQGDFGSKDISNPRSGIAKPGLEYGFDFGLQFRNSPVAFAMSYKRADIPVDFNSASAIAARDLPGFTYDLSTEPWKAKSFLLGISGILNIDSAGTFVIGPRLLAGVMDLTPYQMKIRFTQGAALSSRYPNLLRQKDFAFLFGLNFRYVFLNAFYVSVNADYLHANIEFESYNLTTNGSPQTTTQPVDILSLAVGFGIRW